MKICEYDNVKCPSCGEEGEANEDTTYGLKEIERGNYQGKVFGPMHLIHCFTCSMQFGIPCED